MRLKDSFCQTPPFEFVDSSLSVIDNGLGFPRGDQVSSTLFKVNSRCEAQRLSYIADICIAMPDVSGSELLQNDGLNVASRFNFSDNT
jgi:hypothetical protein